MKFGKFLSSEDVKGMTDQEVFDYVASLIDKLKHGDNLKEEIDIEVDCDIDSQQVQEEGTR